MLKISVIIPVYNAEKFLRKAVESALAQPETDEVLLIEDGSRDDSFSVCQELAREFAPRVRLLQHESGRNKGAGASRNLGITQARCSYLAFLDADDYYLPNRFARAEDLLADSKVDGFYECVGLAVLDDQARTTRLRLENKKLTMKERVSPEDLFFKMRPIGSAGYFSLDGLVIKRSLIEKAGLFNTNMPLSQDTEWLVRLTICGRLVPGEIVEPVTMAGLHQGNRSQYSEKLAANRPVLFLNLVAWGVGRGIDERYRARLVEKLYGFIFVVPKELTWCQRKRLILGRLLKAWWTVPQLVVRPETGRIVRRMIG